MRQARRAAVVTATALLALVLTTACAPEPAPTPSATGFASEEEAFAAAEATYRAYVDAVNERRANAESVVDPTDFLSGKAYSEEIETDALLAERGWTVRGDTVISSVTPKAAT